MERIDTIKTMITFRDSLKGDVGFVPTMGALHEGHISLLQRARQENDAVIVSIFVNPTQFLEGEDFDAYPRKIEADLEICRRIGVDGVFVPTPDMIYHKDELRIQAPATKGFILEGAKRPGHFDGVLQVVMKLFLLTRPTRAYFGKKDAQQLALITQMVHDYFMGIEIVPCEIVRDNDGLALSSRNIYLNADERKRALALSRALKRAGEAIGAGETKVQVIEAIMRDTLQASVDRLEYAVALKRDFSKMDEIIIKDSILLIAAWVGNTRLIDNLWV